MAKLERYSAPGVFDPRGFEHLDRAIALCRKYGLLAILDLHAAPGGQNPDWHSDNLRGESLFWEYADFRRCIDDKSTGAVRVSVGLVSTFADAHALIAFARQFIDQNSDEI